MGNGAVKKVYRLEGGGELLLTSPLNYHGDSSTYQPTMELLLQKGARVTQEEARRAATSVAQTVAMVMSDRIELRTSMKVTSWKRGVEIADTFVTALNELRGHRRAGSDPRHRLKEAVGAGITGYTPPGRTW